MEYNGVLRWVLSDVGKNSRYGWRNVQNVEDDQKCKDGLVKQATNVYTTLQGQPHLQGVELGRGLSVMSC